MRRIHKRIRRKVALERIEQSVILCESLIEYASNICSTATTNDAYGDGLSFDVSRLSQEIAFIRKQLDWCEHGGK